MQFNALSNGISFQTEFKLESIRVNFKQCAYELPYKPVTNLIFQITLNKNTIVSNSRHRLFPKVTYIAYNLMLFERYKLS